MGAIRGVRLESLPHLAVAHGGTTPAPSPNVVGVMAWSTTINRPVWWTGSSWLAVPNAPWWDSPIGAVTITAANDNAIYNTGSTSRAFTVSAGIPMHFSGVTVEGPCTWAAAGGVTLTDNRRSGAGFNFCALEPVAFNTYRLIGVTT